MAPYTSYFNCLPSGLAHKAHRAYNTVVGADFNRDVAEENQRHSTRLEHHDLEVNEDFDADEEWTGISQTVVRGVGMDFEDESFTIKEYHGRPRKLSFKLSEKAAEAACEAAGVSREYLGMALKYFALEVSRDIGWVMHCKTASDAVKAVKKKFPVLEDMQRAFKERSGKGVKPRVVADEYAASRVEEEVEKVPAYSAATRSRSGSQPVYDPQLHAGVEMVPVVSKHDTGPYTEGVDDENDDVDEDDEDDTSSVDSEGFSKAL